MSRSGVDGSASSGVQLAEVVAAIALAADLGLGQPLEQVLQSCVVATRFADHLGVSAADRDATYWVGLFLTAGCTGSSYELSKLFGDDIAFRSGLNGIDPTPLHGMRYFLARASADRGVVDRNRARITLLAGGLARMVTVYEQHCAVSAELASRLGLGEVVVTSLRRSFAQWDGRGLPRGVGGDQIPLPIRIGNIATVATWHLRHGGPEATVAPLRRFARGIFDPDLVAEWCRAAPQILAGVDEESSWERVVGAQPSGRGPLTEDELDAALELIADYADLKSPWFSGHSRGVASLAVSAARHAGVPEPDVTRLRRAALVHDIGRNGVPNSIWDKPGPLTTAELERVHLHAYYTERVLRKASRLADLAALASAAHERSDGSGYPHGIAGSTSVLARILEAADAYHAMREGRPYRAALTDSAARDELKRAARSGAMDGVAVDAVLTAAGHPVRRKASTAAGLTPREQQVLALAARGATSREVAARLSISPKTARNHLEHIYTKIGCTTRAEAALFAMRHNLVPDVESPRR